MAEHLILQKGSCSIRLNSADGVVVVKRDGVGGLEIVFLLLPLILLTLVIFGGLVAVVCMSWIVATQFSGLALLVAIVFGITLLPALYTWFAVQGLLFPFEARLESGRYQLTNGLLRLSRRVPLHEAHIVVYPTYSRGDWGYGAKLKLTRKTLAFPFIPRSIIGTKHAALQEAVKIRDWLQMNSTLADVTLSGWGEIHQIQPGIDYIR
jgi:hypothetical protein